VFVVENGVAQKTREFEDRIGKLESRFYKSTKECFERPEAVEDMILLERLLLMHVHEENQQMKQVYMMEYQEAKKQYDDFHRERSILQYTIDRMQKQQEAQMKKNQPPAPVAPPPQQHQQPASSGRGRGRKRKRKRDDDDDSDDEDFY
jgi:hypothetical protein